LLNQTQKNYSFFKKDFQTLYVNFFLKFIRVFKHISTNCEKDNIYYIMGYNNNINIINEKFVNLVINNDNKYFLNIKEDNYIIKYINKFNECLGTQISLLMLIYFNIDKIYDQFNKKTAFQKFKTFISGKNSATDEISRIRNEIKKLFETKVNELKKLIIDETISIDKKDFKELCNYDGGEIRHDKTNRYNFSKNFNDLNTQCFSFEQQNQPKSSETIESKKNKLKEQIVAIIGEDKKISFEDIDYNKSLITYIEEVYNAKFNHNNSIIHEINESIKQHSQYAKINSCIQNQTTDPVYEIILTTNPDNYANLSKSNIEELKKLLSEYNSLIEQQLSIPVAIEPPSILIGSPGLTGIAGGSHNLRHSIDLIIQSFKKQRPSLNINPDLLYNCILSSSKTNKNKPLRKYNQRTKR
ncbi:MAG: hypothetical protein EBU80_10975, partial [Chitinophagia bacterium]|nr:hypothetical protein [Chitinophagia bacterium]